MLVVIDDIIINMHNYMLKKLFFLVSKVQFICLQQKAQAAGVVFVTICPFPLSAVLFCTLMFPLSRWQCVRIYHIFDKVAQQQHGAKNDLAQQKWIVLDVFADADLIQVSHFYSAQRNPYGSLCPW